MVTWQVSLAARGSAAAALVLWNRVPVRMNYRPSPLLGAVPLGGRPTLVHVPLRKAATARVGTPSLSIAVGASVECALVFYAEPTLRGGHVDI